MKSFFPSGFLARSLMAGVLWAGVASPGTALAQRSGPGSSGRPAYDQWTTYLNPKFGYEVPVPPGLRAQSDPRKGSSCRFASDDGTVMLKVWGTTLKTQPGDPLEDAWREAVNLRGRRIDFQRRTRTGFVLAGINGDGSEFYEKVILGNGATAGASVSYPPPLAARFAPWVDEIERGLGWHPGSAAGGGSGGLPSRWTERDDGVPGPPEQGIPRDPDKTKIDLTPPPVNPRENHPEGIPLEKPDAGAPKPAPAKRDDLPYGIIIPGKKGYVYSPYGDGKQQVDVTDIPTGTKVKCPYTGKVFRVP